MRMLVRLPLAGVVRMYRIIRAIFEIPFAPSIPPLDPKGIRWINSELGMRVNEKGPRDKAEGLHSMQEDIRIRSLPRLRRLFH